MDRHGKQARFNRRNQNHEKHKDRERKKEDLEYNGIKYFNMLEKRVAILLAENEVPFEFSKRFETQTKKGRPNFREVDFWLDAPRVLRGCPSSVQALEVKSRIRAGRSRCQRLELLTAGIETFTVLPHTVDLWEREGLFEDFGLTEKTIRGHKKR